MADVRLVFSGAPVPTPGPVPLVFGVRETPVAQGVRLVFRQAPVPTPGAVRLVFGESDRNAAPSIPDATLSGAAQVTGLRLRVSCNLLLWPASRRASRACACACHCNQLLWPVSQRASRRALRLRIAAVYDDQRAAPGGRGDYGAVAGWGRGACRCVFGSRGRTRVGRRRGRVAASRAAFRRLGCAPRGFRP